VEVTLCGEPWASTDRVAKRNQQVNKQRSGVTFGVRLDLPHDLANESIERLGRRRRRPGR
jgi:hypothetical protein